MRTRARLTVGRIGAGVTSTRADDDVRKQMAQITKNFNLVIKQISAALPEAIIYGMEPIYDKSQEYVPVDTGRLKSSGRFEVRNTQRGSTVDINYGKGGRPGYAAIVHERIDVQHAGKTQAKYLEQAVYEHLGDVIPRVAEFYRRAI